MMVLVGLAFRVAGMSKGIVGLALATVAMTLPS